MVALQLLVADVTMAPDPRVALKEALEAPD